MMNYCHQMLKVTTDHKFLTNIETIDRRENEGTTGTKKPWQKENDQKKIRNIRKGTKGIPTNTSMKILVAGGIPKTKGQWLQIKLNWKAKITGRNF